MKSLFGEEIRQAVMTHQGTAESGDTTRTGAFLREIIEADISIQLIQEKGVPAEDLHKLPEERGTGRNDPRVLEGTITDTA